MAGDLEFAEPGDLVFRPALATDEIDVEPLDVLRLRRRRTFVERAGRRTRERPEVSEPQPPDHVGEREGGEEGEPPGHVATVAAGRDRLAGRSPHRHFLST
jgi:hypothetical protein